MDQPAKRIPVNIDGEGPQQLPGKLAQTGASSEPLDPAMSEAVNAIAISEDGKLTSPQQTSEIKPVPGMEPAPAAPAEPEPEPLASPEDLASVNADTEPPVATTPPADIPRFGALQPKIDEHPLFSGTKEPVPKSPGKKSILKRTLIPLTSLLIVAIIMYLLIDAGVVRGASHLPFHLFKQPVASVLPAINQPEANVQPTTSPTTPDPYTGWKTYTLKYEKLTFKYPSSWKFGSSISAAGDDVSLISPEGLTFLIVTGARPPVDYSSNAKISSEAIKFTGKPALLDLWANAGSSDKTQVAYVELTDTNGKQFNALNAPKDTQTGNSLIDVEIGFGSVTNNSPKTVPVSSLSSNTDYSDAKLIIQSMTY